MIDGQVSFKNYCCYMYTTVLLTILEIHQQIRLLYCWLCELDFGYHSRLLKMSTVVQIKVCLQHILYEFIVDSALKSLEGSTTCTLY